MDVYNDNNEPISDCEKESCHRDYKPGLFYNGNKEEKAGSRQAGEGSMGALYNQGAIRSSNVPEIMMLAQSKDASALTIPEGKQGSAAQLLI